MNSSEFLEVHQAQWPLGKMQTLHQIHHIAIGSPLAHPLQSHDFLRTATFIQVTVCKPKYPPLPFSEMKEFIKKISDCAHKEVTFNYGLEIDESDRLKDTISVSILAAQLQD